MKDVEQFAFEPKYRRDGIIVLNLDPEQALPFHIQERTAVYIPYGEIGGNHRHPRREVFVCLGSGAELHWIDEASGETRVQDMSPINGIPQAFMIGSMVAHAVVSTVEAGITLLEFADDTQHDVEEVAIVG